MQTSFHDEQLWKSQMHSYQKQKRTKKPFGKQFTPSHQIITESMVKQSQTRFNPVLQVYKNSIDQSVRDRREESIENYQKAKHANAAKKHEKDYDIINLYPNSLSDSPYSEKAPKTIAPVRNIYNVINNQKLPDFHFMNRPMKVPIEHPFKRLDKNPRQYDIISNNYFNGNQQRRNVDYMEEQNKIMNKYNKTRIFDPVNGRYYDQGKEEEYQEYLKRSQLVNSEKFEKKLPPSYVNRQPLILDHSKPYSPVLQAYDQKKSNAKKRYQMKYMIEQEYAKRNDQFNEKKQLIVRSRVHNARVIQHMGRQFDIINSKHFSPEKSQDLFGRKPVNSTWDRLAESSSSSYMKTAQVPIKTSGFS